MRPSEIESSIFSIGSEDEFNELALEIFRFQFKSVKPYREYCELLNIKANQIQSVDDIPFIPIELFKTHDFISEALTQKQIFTSSGTTGSQVSRHLVASLDLYEQSFLKCFEQFYGPVHEYRVLALLPAYLERKGSSLVYMADKMIQLSDHTDSGFFLDDLTSLKTLLLEKDARKTLLIGVSFALLDLVETGAMQLENTIVMETGGMKGRKKEMTRQELHAELQAGFGLQEIHSEYGMTELLSQAYARTQGAFEKPPWMKIKIRDVNDPLSPAIQGKTGGVNIIDLANLYSCSFIATSDLGRQLPNGNTEILGRFDFSETRGCNLMVSDYQ